MIISIHCTGRSGDVGSMCIVASTQAKLAVLSGSKAVNFLNSQDNHQESSDFLFSFSRTSGEFKYDARGGIWVPVFVLLLEYYFVDRVYCYLRNEATKSFI